MIRLLRGNCYHDNDGTITVETDAGIGFRVYIPAGSCFYGLAEGDDVKVYTSMIVRQDEISLFGFPDKIDRNIFELLLKVNGVGPKAAMAILSALSTDQLRQAIATEDVGAIRKVSGIGAKTAARIVLELKDKVEPVEGLTASGDEQPLSPAGAEAISALVALGYSKTEAESALEKIVDKDLDVEGLIKAALKSL